MRYKLLFVFLLLPHILSANPDTLVRHYDYNYNYCAPEFSFYVEKAWKEDSLWHAKDFYTKNNALAFDGYFIDDSLTIGEGQFLYYYPNGDIKTKEHFGHGKYNGLRTRYSENGLLMDSTNYRQDVIVGESYKYNEQGKIVYRGNFDTNGSGKGEEWHYYYDEGTLFKHCKTSGYDTTKGKYIRDSIWTYYYPDGLLACKEHYRYGSLILRSCYNKKGKLCVCKNQEAKIKHFIFTSFFIGIKIARQYRSSYKLCKNQLDDTIKGTLVVKISIDIDGKLNGKLIQGISPCLDELVLDIVNNLTIKATPRIVNNCPQKVERTMSINIRNKKDL